MVSLAPPTCGNSMQYTLVDEGLIKEAKIPVQERDSQREAG